MDEKHVEISRRARAELNARVADAVGSYAATRVELERWGDELPRPGDLYVMVQAPEQPLEWLVVDADPARRDRLLVVPADPQPLVGSADVAVADAQPGGPLALRCGHVVEMDAALFDAEMRTGRVADETLEQARDKLRQLAGAQTVASTEQVETDADPEYALWIEDVITPARVALEAAGQPRLRLVPGTATESEEKSASASAPRIWRGWRRRRVRIAALPLAACLAWLLVGAPGWRHDPRVATLVLAASTRVGGEPSLTLAPDTEIVELRIDLGDDEAYRNFRATLTTLGGVEVWRTEVLAPSATGWGGEVIVRLPADRLPAGDYELALEMAGADGGVSEVGFYSFRVTYTS